MWVSVTRGPDGRLRDVHIGVRESVAIWGEVFSGMRLEDFYIGDGELEEGFQTGSETEELRCGFLDAT